MKRCDFEREMDFRLESFSNNVKTMKKTLDAYGIQQNQKIDYEKIETFVFVNEGLFRDFFKTLRLSDEEYYRRERLRYEEYIKKLTSQRDLYEKMEKMAKKRNKTS